MKRALTFYTKKESPYGLNHDILFLVISFILIIVVSGTFGPAAYAQTNLGNDLITVSIKDGDEWRYMRGTQFPPRKWHSNDFDHSRWQKGPSRFGYGSVSSGTYLGDMPGNYLTVYVRREFIVDNPGMIRDMNLSIVCDGPFIAYLNDREIIRTKTIQIVPAGQSPGVQLAEQYNMNGFIHELNRGKNTLAIQCDNDDINSEDFTFIPVFEVLKSKEVLQ